MPAKPGTRFVVQAGALVKTRGPGDQNILSLDDLLRMFGPVQKI